MERLISTILGILLGGMVVLLAVVAIKFGGFVGGIIYVGFIFVAILLFTSERKE